MRFEKYWLYSGIQSEEYCYLWLFSLLILNPHNMLPNVYDKKKEVREQDIRLATVSLCVVRDEREI